MEKRKRDDEDTPLLGGQNAIGDAGPSFEESLKQLESIVLALETGNLGLDESLARYEQAVGHLKRCHGLLQRAEHRVELITGFRADGTMNLEPFQPTSDSPSEKRIQPKPAEIVLPYRPIVPIIDPVPWAKPTVAIPGLLRVI